MKQDSSGQNSQANSAPSALLPRSVLLVSPLSDAPGLPVAQRASIAGVSPAPETLGSVFTLLLPYPALPRAAESDTDRC